MEGRHPAVGCSGREKGSRGVTGGEGPKVWRKGYGWPRALVPGRTPQPLPPPGPQSQGAPSRISTGFVTKLVHIPALARLAGIRLVRSGAMLVRSSAGSPGGCGVGVSRYVRPEDTVGRSSCDGRSQRRRWAWMSWGHSERQCGRSRSIPSSRDREGNRPTSESQQPPCPGVGLAEAGDDRRVGTRLLPRLAAGPVGGDGEGPGAVGLFHDDGAASKVNLRGKFSRDDLWCGRLALHRCSWRYFERRCRAGGSATRPAHFLGCGEGNRTPGIEDMSLALCR